MTRTAIASDKLPPPAGPYSAAIQTDGCLFVSGQVGIDPSTAKLVPGGIDEQTAQAFSNLQAVLEAAGKSFADAVRVGVYLTSMSDFAAMNGIYARYFSAPFPARTTIGVAALPLGARVEIDMVVQ